MTNINEMMPSVQLLNALKYPVTRMPEDDFIPFLCMLAEEYCLARHLDVCEMANQIQTLITEVNAELGAYGT